MTDEGGKVTGMPKKTTPSRARSDVLPQSLGQVMRVLRYAPPKGAATKEGKARGEALSVADLAAVLDRTPGRVPAPRKNKKSAAKIQRKAAKFTKNTVNRLERSKSFDIWKVARYANWSGYPVSVIMLIQELSSHLRDGKLELVKQIATATASVCKHAVENADRLSGQGSGAGEGMSSAQRAEFVADCRNTDPSSEKDVIYLIALELLKKYPEEALEAKRTEWRDKK